MPNDSDYYASQKHYWHPDETLYHADGTSRNAVAGSAARATGGAEARDEASQCVCIDGVVQRRLGEGRECRAKRLCDGTARHEANYDEHAPQVRQLQMQ